MTPRQKSQEKYRTSVRGRAMDKVARAKRYAQPGKLKAERQRGAATRRARFNAWMIVLKNAPCKDCGHIFPPCAMDFDHVRGVKMFEISRGLDKPRRAVIDEIAKCDLVCAVHHRIRTAERLALIR
jgi:hypothetical protein